MLFSTLAIVGFFGADNDAGEAIAVYNGAKNS